MARRVGCNGSGVGGMNPSPTHGGRFAVNVVGGGVLDAPRRGQDPSLRCKRYMGGNGEVEGRACPAPTGRRGRVADERGKGGRQPAPFPLTGGDAKPVGTLQASQARPAPLMGSHFARAKPARGASPSGEVAAKQAGRVRGLADGCPLMGYYGRLRAAYMPPLQSCRSPLRRFGGTPSLRWRKGRGR